MNKSNTITMPAFNSKKFMDDFNKKAAAIIDEEMPSINRLIARARELNQPRKHQIVHIIIVK